MNMPPNDANRTHALGACEDQREALALYVDGELGADARRAFEEHMEGCTECRREVAVFQAMKGDLRSMSMERVPPPRGSIWESVNRDLTRPTGWLMIVAGAIIYTAWAVYNFIQAPLDLWERLGIGLLVVGFFVLLISVAIDRIRDSATDPYKGIQR